MIISCYHAVVLQNDNVSEASIIVYTLVGQVDGVPALHFNFQLREELNYFGESDRALSPGIHTIR